METSNEDKKWGVPTLIGIGTAIVVFVAILWAISVTGDGDFGILDEADQSVKEEKWQIYTNESLGFRLEYPPNWHVSESVGVQRPAVTIHKKLAVVGELPPFGPLVNSTFVSIFPRGISDNIVVGLISTSTIKTVAGEFDISDHLLSSGEVWSRSFAVTNAPEPWTDSGFIFARTQVDDFEEYCFIEEEEIPVGSCLSKGNGTLVRDGTIDDKSDFEIKSRILSSFAFIEVTESQSPISSHK
ncbi:MAG: hypothetical protein COV70_01925 [Parcubacteria group bacterium CG11_big_fil_rev_8_21_14_0_20_39_22]|nr:MAG: hypothetical protein COV70_01925 [Parcubacteria group bacterium CG11_big_fil_rev_8_21_14_0_20_39_22]